MTILFQTYSIPINEIALLLDPFQQALVFLCVCCITPLKTLWEKEKLLATSNFSFSHSVFYPLEELSSISTKFKIVVCKLFRIGRVQNLSFGKGLNLRTQYLNSYLIFIHLYGMQFCLRISINFSILY